MADLYDKIQSKAVFGSLNMRPLIIVSPSIMKQRMKLSCQEPTARLFTVREALHSLRITEMRGILQNGQTEYFLPAEGILSLP